MRCGLELPPELQREVGARVQSVAHTGEIVGRVLEGRYRIDRFVARGGMGEVYAGVDTTLDRPVAVKFLAEELSQEAELVRRFLREAQACARLDHPNLVSVYAAGRLGPRPFFVMRYVRGRTLAEWLAASGRLSVPAALDIALQVCEGLDIIHRAGFVHRDIKPQNLMVEPDGRCVILDLGILRRVDQSLTSSGVITGTPAYIAPEQAREPKTVDGRADLYALGVTLFEMLTAQLPFRAASAFELLVRHQTQPPPRPSAVVPELPGLLDSIVLQLLAKEPALRYQSARELRAALLAARTELEQRPGSTLAFVPVPPPAPPAASAPAPWAPRVGLDYVNAKQANAKQAEVPAVKAAAVIQAGPLAAAPGSSGKSPLGGNAAAGSAGAPAVAKGAEPAAKGAPGAAAGLVTAPPSKRRKVVVSTIFIAFAAGGSATGAYLAQRCFETPNVQRTEVGERVRAVNAPKGDAIDPAFTPPADAPPLPPPLPSGDRPPLGAAEPGERAEVLPADRGRLAVSTLPADAQLRIDGRPVGRTPFDLLLAPGQYTVELTRAGHEPHRETARVVGGARERVHVTLKPKKARLEVVTKGPAGVVTIDGAVVGEGERVSSELPPGRHMVRVRAGFQQTQQEVTLEPGDEKTIELRLEGKAGPVPVPGRNPRYLRR